MYTKFLYFLGGAVIGAAATYFSLNLYLRKVYEEKAQEEIDAFQEALENPKTEEKEEIKEEKDIPYETSSIQKVTKKSTENYASAVKSYETDDDSDEEEWPEWAVYDSGPTERKNEQSKSTTPYIISEEDHFEASPRYDCIECYWRPGEGHLVDSDGHIIDDVDATVGYENLEKLEDSTNGNTGEIFVRNDYLSVDYEVILEWMP